MFSTGTSFQTGKSVCKCFFSVHRSHMCEYTHNFLVGSNEQLTLVKMFVFRMLQNGCMKMCKSRAVDVVFSGLVCSNSLFYMCVCVFLCKISLTSWIEDCLFCFSLTFCSQKDFGLWIKLKIIKGQCTSFFLTLNLVACFGEIRRFGVLALVMTSIYFIFKRSQSPVGI